MLPFASHVEPGARGRTLAAIARRRVPGILIAARTPTVASQAAALAVGADVVTMDELAAADAML